MTSFVSLRAFFIAATVSCCTFLTSCESRLQAVEPTQPQSVVTAVATTQTTSSTPVSATSVQNVTFQNAKGLTLTAKLYLPAVQAGQTVPAVVVMHGCGGMWSNDNVAANVMKNNFNEWATLLMGRGIAALFVDSFTPRNEVEFCGVVPPNDAKLSPAYERPLDAFAALNFLRTLPQIEDNRVGLLGFSHGASTAMSALVDVPKVTKDTWRVRYNGVWYTVPGPVDRPAAGGFKTAIAYYPGGGFFSYYGSISDASSGKYVTYAPLLILSGGNDDLTPATQVQYNRALLNGSVGVEMEVYPNANHSFDEVTSSAAGADWTAKQQARQRALNWLQTTL